MNRYPEPTRLDPIPRTATDGAAVLWVLSLLAITSVAIAGLLVEGWLTGFAILFSGFAGVMLGASNVPLDMRNDGYIADRVVGPDGKKRWRIGIKAGGGATWI